MPTLVQCLRGEIRIQTNKYNAHPVFETTNSNKYNYIQCSPQCLRRQIQIYTMLTPVFERTDTNTKKQTNTMLIPVFERTNTNTNANKYNADPSVWDDKYK